LLPPLFGRAFCVLLVASLQSLLEQFLRANDKPKPESVRRRNLGMAPDSGVV